MASTEKARENSNLQINVIYFSGFLDLFAVSMIMPLILPQAIELGASPALAGVLGSVYGGLQLVTSPVIGKWSDGVSRQFSLLVCMLFSGFGYTLMGLSSSVLVFFISRFMLGCFKHSQTISRAFLAEVVRNQPSRQASMLGGFNSWSSAGFILGPVFGGHMAETSAGFPLVAMATGLVFVANAGLVWWLIPSEEEDTIRTHGRCSEADLTRSDTALSLEKVGSEEINLNFSKVLASFKDLNWPDLWDLLLMRYFAGFSMIIFRTNFTMVLKHKFAASPSTIGYMTSFSGVIAALSGFVIGTVTESYKNDNARLLLHSTIFQVAALLCLTLAPSLSVLLVALVPLNLVTSISRVSATTLTVATASGAVDKTGSPVSTDASDPQSGKGKRSRSRSSNTMDHRDSGEARSTRPGAGSAGGIIGLGQSVMALARMSAPLVAGVAQELGGVDAPSYISVVSAAISVAVMVGAGRGWGSTGGKRKETRTKQD